MLLLFILAIRFHEIRSHPKHSISPRDVCTPPSLAAPGATLKPSIDNRTHYVKCAFNDENNIDGACVLEIHESNTYHNMGCRVCKRRVKGSPMCWYNEEKYGGECCCKKPFCNAELMEDFYPTKFSLSRTQENKDLFFCLKTLFMNNMWYYNHREDCPTKRCFMSYSPNFEGKRINALLMGCAPMEMKGSCKTHCDANILKSNKSVQCCCTKNECNAFLYRTIIFEQIVLKIRQDQETAYIKTLHQMSLVSEDRLWHETPGFLKLRPYMNGIIVFSVTFYLLMVVFVYIFYAPVKIHMRPWPKGSSADSAAVIYY